MQAQWWHPDHFSLKKDNLVVRGRIIKAMRRFFDDQSFDEVETPILQTCPVMDTHIHAFKTELKGVDLKIKSTPYLHTSPEFDMKKLVVAGIDNLYQICHVFRNAEGSKRHSPEFTMIEWYRTKADYNDIMDDCVGLLRACATMAGITEYKHKDFTSDPFQEFEHLTVAQAFKQYADICLISRDSALSTVSFQYFSEVFGTP
jgi:lysyl-tRNA synthetase class 2